MVGAGNDFIVLDLRHDRPRGSLPALAKNLCRRAQAIGADGLLIIEPSRRADVRMRVLNPDGSEAAMCGNGSRCVARYAAQRLGRRRVTLETRAGLIRADVLSRDRVRVMLPSPSPVGTRRLTVRGRSLTVHTLNTGVPHAVVIVGRRVDVPRLGAAIRRHAAFRPAGTNVDFIQIVNAHTLRLRTYERGVEAETQACGTGAVAAALVAAWIGQCRPPVTVYPTSGERLTIRFARTGDSWHDVSLEGAVRQVFTGVIS
ncbi:MAG: diaminopimelate epimerase [Candidatus Omnitrophica bacterium]|nr:diaminopimelate epimerase [Candidatus Omnitrophota bacterium]